MATFVVFLRPLLHLTVVSCVVVSSSDFVLDSLITAVGGDVEYVATPRPWSRSNSWLVAGRSLKKGVM